LLLALLSKENISHRHFVLDQYTSLHRDFDLSLNTAPGMKRD